jgi:hypothetical protein
MIVFGCGTVSSLRLQLILARYLRQSGRQVAFIVWQPEHRTGPFRQEIGDLGECRSLGPPPNALPAPTKGDSGKLAQIRNYHTAGIAQAKERFQGLNPEAVVVSEDGISADLHFLHAAKQLRLPIVDVPFGYNMKIDLEGDLAIKEAQAELIRPTDLWAEQLRRVAPQWFKTGAFSGATMFPSLYTLAAHEAGIRLPDPWFVHGGIASVLCAEGERPKRVYLAEGVPHKKIVVTGSPYCDQMVHAARRDPAAQMALRQPERIESDRTRFLVSWGPSYHGSRAHLSEFDSYEHMTLSLLRRLRDLPAAAVTVSLHPACDPAVAEMLPAEGFDVTTEFVIDLIPRHDVYVTFFSSTIRWALACGKPVLNYDAYGWELAAYDSPGFFTSRRADEIVNRALELTTPDGFQRSAAAQCAVAEEWGPLDGNACARIAEILLPKKPSFFERFANMRRLLPGRD